MAVSNVKIANLALQKLGQPKRLESLTQDHANARSMNAAFEMVRDRLLRKYTWSFAIKRASVAADGDGPTWGDYNRYALPNDFIRLIRDDETGLDLDWKVEGRYILSADAAPLEFRYVAQIVDPAQFDSLFVETFACELAAQTCKEITGSTALMAELRADRDMAAAEAKQVGAIEKAAQDFPEDPWLLARL